MTVSPLDLLIPENERLEGQPCSNCLKEFYSDDNFCTYCGFPLLGSSEQISDYRRNEVTLHSTIRRNNSRISGAKVIIYLVAAIIFLGGWVEYENGRRSENSHAATILFFINGLIASLFLILAFWSRKNSFPGLLSVLLLYVFIIIFNYLIGQNPGISTILIQLVIIIFLTRGVRAAYENIKIEKELAFI